MSTPSAGFWEQAGTGIGVYVKLADGNEPAYLGGMIKGYAQVEDIDAAIRWLTVLRKRAVQLQSQPAQQEPAQNTAMCESARKDSHD